MSPEEIEHIIEKTIREGLQFPWWIYLLIIIATFVGGFFGAYLKRKGENLATKEEFNTLLTQVEQTTETTEGIKNDLSKGNWIHQQSWYLKEKYYTGLLEALYRLKVSLSDRLGYYIEPGSEHDDKQVNQSAQYKSLAEQGIEALQQIQQLHGPAEMVVSDRAIEALKKFYSVDWHASNFSSGNYEYLTDVIPSVDKAYQIILEEDRLELR